jgi:hypothetical protein
MLDRMPCANSSRCVLVGMESLSGLPVGACPPPRALLKGTTAAGSSAKELIVPFAWGVAAGGVNIIAWLLYY